MRALIALLAGLIFGLGLLLAGMANPAKVLGFLDLTGTWDPSLALVMVSAIAVAILPFSWAKRQKGSLLGEAMQLPQNRVLDRRLIGGSLTFGIGWGIAGICPGPAIVGLGAGFWQTGVFFGAMLAGMILFEVLERFTGKVGLGNATP
jgi:uncharacterized membrane protein YedE/YeeE